MIEPGVSPTALEDAEVLCVLLAHRWEHGVNAGRCSCGQTLEGIVSHAQHLLRALVDSGEVVMVSTDDAGVRHFVAHWKGEVDRLAAEVTRLAEEAFDDGFDAACTSPRPRRD